MKREVNSICNSIPVFWELKTVEELDNMSEREQDNYWMRRHLYWKLHRNLVALTARNANLKPVMELNLEEARLAASRTGDINRMRQLMQYRNGWVKENVAYYNPRTPDFILKELCKDEDSTVCFLAKKSLYFRELEKKEGFAK